MWRRTFALWSLVVPAALAAAHGCGDDETSGGGSQDGSAGPGGPDLTGATCKAPADCYPGIDQTTVEGDVMCLDRVPGGYCTHSCADDANCCAVAGECEDDITVVCSPFESTDDKMCFLSCEDADLVPAPGQSGAVDPEEFCQRAAGPSFTCRSSGGGNQNRKVCVPGDCGVGATCAADGDCASGLTCILGLKGGYCTEQDCATDTDCPADSLCVKHTDGKAYCFATCAGEYDCSFCRGTSLAAACADGVVYSGPAMTGTVCVPP